MATPLPDVAELLEVTVPADGKVLVISDLHLPPVRTAVSGRCCEILVRRLTASDDGLTVMLAGDVVELLAFSESNADEILQAHEDLCAALATVIRRGGQVIYAIGNHDGDLGWNLKEADAVRERTGATLCLAADLVFGEDARIRVEHGHQLDPYNCFHDPRNPLDTPLGHHIVRQVIPKIEWLGRDWLTGAHEMADPGDFPSFLASRLVYRKLARHMWWLLLLPVLLMVGLRVPEVVNLRARYPDTGRYLRDAEVLGYGAVVDLIIIAIIVAVVSRRAWTSISALALAERGYGQNHAARQRAADLIADGYAGLVSGHTHHPELRRRGAGFYANSGSCTSVVEAIETVRGLPPVYLRTQQISWLELATGSPDATATSPDPVTSPGGVSVQLKSARIELPGATRLERFVTSGRSPHASAPCAVASWPAGTDWPETAASSRTTTRCRGRKSRRGDGK